MAGQVTFRAFVLTAFVAIAGGTSVADLRPALNRPEVLEIGEPILVSRGTLKTEMERNSDLKEYVERYGWPDYAEIQRTAVSEPLEDYEVRLYYLDREQELVFVHVHVAPAMTDYGIKRYEGPIPDATLARILTAHMNEPAPIIIPAPTGETAPAVEASEDAAPAEAEQQAAAEPAEAEASAPAEEKPAADVAEGAAQ